MFKTSIVPQPLAVQAQFFPSAILNSVMTLTAVKISSRSLLGIETAAPIYTLNSVKCCKHQVHKGAAKASTLEGRD